MTQSFSAEEMQQLQQFMGTSSDQVVGNVSDGLTQEDLQILDGLVGAGTNDATGELLPAPMNGTSPDRAKKQSIISATDRMALKNLGDYQGGEQQFLKDRYDDAVRGKDGRLKVQKDGAWYEVDPDNDAWETTKNLIKSINGVNSPEEAEALMDIFGDNLDIAAFATTSVAAGAVATGVVSTAGVGTLPALAIGATIQAAGSAGIEYMRTSLGRAVGTYQASEEEQLMDIGLEAVLGAGGEFFPPAMKLTTKQAAKRFIRAGKNLKALSRSTKEFLKGGFGAVMGDQALDQLLEHGDEVGKFMARSSNANTVSDAIENLGRQNVEELRTVIKRGTKAATATYGKKLDEIAKSVPGSYKFEPRAIVEDALSAGFDEGVLEMKLSAAQLKKFGGLEGAMNAARQGKVKLSELIGIVPMDRAAQKVARRTNGQQLSAFAQNKEAYSATVNMYKNILGNADFIKPQSGQKGFTAASNVKRLITDSTKAARDALKDSGATQATNRLANIASRTKDVYKEALPGDIRLAVDSLENSYSAMKTNLAPFFDAAQKMSSTRNLAIDPVEQVLNKIQSGASKNLLAKNSMSELTDFLASNGNKKLAGELSSAGRRMRSRAAAASVTPWVTGQGNIALKAGTSIVLLGALSGGDLTTTAGGSFLGTAFLQSPRALANSIRIMQRNVPRLGKIPGAKAGAQLLNRYGLKAVNAMRLGGKAAKSVADRERLMSEVFKGSIRAAASEDPEALRAAGESGLIDLEALSRGGLLQDE